LIACAVPVAQRSFAADAEAWSIQGPHPEYSSIPGRQTGLICLWSQSITVEPL
jgi:hypothetical protein